VSWSIVKSAAWGAASLMGAALMAGPALADGMPSSGKIASPESRVCSGSGNVGVTSDYIFRGVSQNMGEPALQGGVDLTCGKFYVGVWGSNVVGETQGVDIGSVEFDIFAGYRFSTGKINWDLGLIYYVYPGPYNKVDSIEWKLGASTGLWKGANVSATALYNFEDEVGIYELGFSQSLPKVGIFTPTFSATYGQVHYDAQDSQYSYWNAGVTLGFAEKWSLDLRYWDSDLDPGFVFGTQVQGEPKYVATLKYSF
jgi:uncharacterized protein (TIGR02001 family)